MRGSRGRKLAFAALVAAALGFGGTQALAAPSQGAPDVCDDATCYKLCVEVVGATYGRCTPGGATGGVGCSCYWR